MGTLAESPVFVTGHGGSGTTLLLACLDAHPELLVFPWETAFFSQVWPKAKQDRSAGVGHLMYRVRDLPRAANSADGRAVVDMDFDAYEQRLWERYSSSGSTGKGLLQAIVLAYGEVRGEIAGGDSDAKRTHWVEKTPLTELHLGTLRQWFPDLKVIHVVRDPRDNYATVKRKREKAPRPGFNLRAYCWEWGQSSRAAIRFRDRLPMLIVRYEDLLTRHADTMQSISRFLGIEFADSLLHPTMAGTPWFGNSAFGQRASTVDPTRMGRWREHLSASEIRYLEAALRKGMNAFGYEPTEAVPRSAALRATLLDQLPYSVYQRLRRIPDPLKRPLRAVLRR